MPEGESFLFSQFRGVNVAPWGLRDIKIPKLIDRCDKQLARATGTAQTV